MQLFITLNSQWFSHSFTAYSHNYKYTIYTPLDNCNWSHSIEWTYTLTYKCMTQWNITSHTTYNYEHLHSHQLHIHILYHVSLIITFTPKVRHMHLIHIWETLLLYWFMFLHKHEIIQQQNLSMIHMHTQYNHNYTEQTCSHN